MNGLILTYSVIQRENVSDLGTSKRVYRIIFQVEEIPSRESMSRTAESVWSNGNANWDEFTIFGYLPGMDTGSAAYAVAEFQPSGMIDFRIQPVALLGTRWEKE